MEEILQHLGCINLVNNGINYQPQLVQDLFHQQYHTYLTLEILPAVGTQQKGYATCVKVYRFRP